ncbi:hypothetical protein APUTEX25_001106 [Auxenochlorella protothecoides]|uniref:Uncharacterized protein n=1 Tax=Auxenochlorella protothecoides TaxID=3075 RepID=A0A3M7KRK1_AUXPR|nr:hypothetical protein APUTEX25_001106 [Auxenochlorella protothecoides]|eukprot:RMZ52987.1 hypothetical protein APUTEX25_001106 [Auxenochlorella protothecoides]
MSGAAKVARTASRAVRSFTSSSKAASGGHLFSLFPPPAQHEPDYVHAPSMYNLPAMKNRKLKFGLSVGGVVALGIALPVVSRGEHTSSDSRAIWAGIACQWQVGLRDLSVGLKCV